MDFKMNERIRELIKQATNPNYDSDDGPMNELNVEKFAELIVRECAEVCKAQSTYDPIVLPYKPSEQFEKAIREHFGVEE
jgi:hypothetical protein